MKLLDPKQAESSLKKEENELKERNHRLKTYLAGGIKRLNTLKESYEPDKEVKLKEFEAFCQALASKKSELLKDYDALENLIESKKDLYYALVERADLIEEKNIELEIKNKKMEDREKFVIESEAKLQEKWNQIIKK